MNQTVINGLLCQDGDRFGAGERTSSANTNTLGYLMFLNSQTPVSPEEIWQLSRRPERVVYQLVMAEL